MLYIKYISNFEYVGNCNKIAYSLPTDNFMVHWMRLEGHGFPFILGYHENGFERYTLDFGQQ